ncbi:hypothetical protein LDENG_00233790 [Lucifuga dentata]|nr:hypothetical protein LDENG_00233790 [Lucifuga dentata]
MTKRKDTLSDGYTPKSRKHSNVTQTATATNKLTQSYNIRKNTAISNKTRTQS